MLNKPTATCSSNIIAIYDKNNMSTKLGICAIFAKYLTGIYGEYEHICMPHMKSLVPNMLPGVLYTVDKNDAHKDNSSTFDCIG